MKIKAEIAKQITSDIVKGLEEHGSWNKCWKSGLPMNLKTKKAYRGMNLIITWNKGFSSPYWVSMRQTNELGGKIKKGERATWILTPRIVKKKDKEGNEKEFLLGFGACKIWNVEQTTLEIPEVEKREVNTIKTCVEIIENYPNSPEIKHGEVGAWYNPTEDLIGMPNQDTFETDESYYKTLFHELTHSTGHESRLARELKGRYDTKSYSYEELIAELGSLFLSAFAGIDKNIENSKAYVRGWITPLKDNPEWIIKASSQAQKSCDYILGGK